MGTQGISPMTSAGRNQAGSDTAPEPVAGLAELAEVRRRTEEVFDRTLSAMFGAMEVLSQAEGALVVLSEAFSPAEVARLRGLQDIFQGLASDVEAKVARSREAAARLERLMRAGGGRLDDLRRLTRTAALVALNAQVVTGTIRADGGALDNLARTMRQVLSQVADLVSELAAGIERGRDDLRAVQDSAASLQNFADREAVPTIQHFARLMEARARDRGLSRSAGLVSGRLKALQNRLRLVVTHLQVGDGLRQRLEHVEAILALSAQPGSPPPALLRRLAALQVRGALSDLTHAMHEGRRCLRGLGRTAGAISGTVAIGEFGGEGAGGLAPLIDRAERIETAIEGLSRTGRGLSQASESLAQTLGEVGRATQTAAEFERRMTVLGINAILLSSRLGTEGRAMVEVAQQLRDIARNITEVIAQLRHDTEGIALTAGGLDKPEDEALSGRLVIAAEAAAQVSLLGHTVGEQLVQMKALQDAGDIAETFWRAERDLETFSRSAESLERVAALLEQVGERMPNLPAGAEEGVSAIRCIYTMQAERDIHDALFPKLAPTKPDEASNSESDEVTFFASGRN